LKTSRLSTSLSFSLRLRQGVDYGVRIVVVFPPLYVLFHCIPPSPSPKTKPPPFPYSICAYNSPPLVSIGTAPFSRYFFLHYFPCFSPTCFSSTYSSITQRVRFQQVVGRTSSTLDIFPPNGRPKSWTFPPCTASSLLPPRYPRSPFVYARLYSPRPSIRSRLQPGNGINIVPLPFYAYGIFIFTPPPFFSLTYCSQAFCSAFS